MPDKSETGTIGGKPARHAGERRWPMAAAVLTTVLLQFIAPRHGRIPGWQAFPSLELVLLGLLIVRDPGRIDRRSLQLRRATFALIAVMTAATLGGSIVLIRDILTTGSDVNATTLLGRGAALWVNNVIVFSLWYWELDRGGPAERAAGSSAPVSFAFPENATPELAPPGWMPQYPDYLYLAFTNATAFSPTDTLPVRMWAKMTLMAQSAISLMLAILVIARAINVIPGS
jgi:uncharacterized membrane protein